MTAAVTHKQIAANRGSLLKCFFMYSDKVCGFIDFFAAKTIHSRPEVSVVEHNAYDQVGQLLYL